MNKFKMFASVLAPHPKPPVTSPNQGAAVWIPVACFPCTAIPATKAQHNQPMDLS